MSQVGNSNIKQQSFRIWFWSDFHPSIPSLHHEVMETGEWEALAPAPNVHCSQWAPLIGSHPSTSLSLTQFWDQCWNGSESGRYPHAKPSEQYQVPHLYLPLPWEPQCPGRICCSVSWVSGKTAGSRAFKDPQWTGKAGKKWACFESHRDLGIR